MTTGTVVGIDTSTRSTSVAVFVPSGRQVERRDDPAAHESPRHASVLQPLLEQALEQALVTWDDVTRICVGTGPGGFTGLRLGVSTARALSQGRDLPVVGVSSLEALARGIELVSPTELDLPGKPDVSGPVLAVIDARRGEVFAAIYRHHRTTMEASAMTPEELAERISTRREWGRNPILAVGDGAVRFRVELERAGAAVPSDGSPAHRVSALMVCRLGRAREPVDRDALLPDYRREPDAVPPATPELTAPPAAAIQVRRLTYADLPQVVAIERRAFTSPWSLAMFVLELSKPSGICLAAEIPGLSGEPELGGYMICSRYDTVWHVMNVAVDPTQRRRGIATAMLNALLERVGRDAQLTLEVRRSNSGAITLYESFGFRSAGVRRRYYQDNGEDAIVMWRTPATLRGTLDDVPGT